MTVTPQDIFGTSPKSVLNKPMMHVQEQYPDGTDAPATVVGYQTRLLNTVLVDEIPGASLSGNEIILPAGTYYVEAVATCSTRNSALESRLAVRTAADVDLVRGINRRSQAANSAAEVNVHLGGGKFTLSAPTNIKLSQYTQAANITGGLGREVGDAGAEVYADLRIWKLDSDIETPVISDPTLTLARPLMHVQNNRGVGGSGGAISADTWAQRDLTDVLTNEIAGASLAANKVTLPAGEYHIECHQPLYKSSNTTGAIRKVSDSSVLLQSLTVVTGSSDSVSVNPIITGRITLTETTEIEVAAWSVTGATTFGAGTGGSGNDTIIVDLRIWQLDAVNKQPVLVNDKLFPLPGNVIVTGNMHGLEYAYKDALTVTVQPGICMDSTNENVLQLSAAQDVAFPAGNVDTVYNLFLTDDAETVKFDTDVDGASLPAQDKRRWIGFVHTDGSGNVASFVMGGDTIEFNQSSQNHFPDTLQQGSFTVCDHSTLVPVSRIHRIDYGFYGNSTGAPCYYSNDGTNVAGVIGNVDYRDGGDVNKGAFAQYLVSIPYNAARGFRLGSPHTSGYLILSRVQMKR